MPEYKLKEHWNPAMAAFCGWRSKFVICSSQRSGSEMLRRCLNQHSQLNVAGEIFILPEEYGLTMKKSVPEMVDEAFEHFNGFKQHRHTELPTTFGDKESRSKGAWGFLRCFDVWKEVAEREEVKVIDLRRKDILAMVVSYHVANMTNIWIVGNEETAGVEVGADLNELMEKPTFRFPPEHLKAEMDHRVREYSMCEILLANHERHIVCYEDMIADPQLVIAQVQNFLGVEPEPFEVGTSKQEQRPLREIIENYDELQEYFQGTHYAQFFK